MSESARKISRFYFKDTDAGILKHLTDYRFLQPSDFVRLTGRNLISIRRRLRQLNEHGYVARLRLPIERVAPMVSPPSEFVYHIAGRGVGKAKQYGLVDDEYRAPQAKSNILLPHDLIITKFHLALHLAIANMPFKIVAWKQSRSELLDWVDHDSGRLSVNPDAYFGLKHLEKPEGENTFYFFLEIERSGENDFEKKQSNFMRKMHAFLHYHRQGKHTRRYGISNFRVITVTPTKERAVNLCNKLHEAGLPFKRFWLAPLSTVDPARILESVFFTPKDFRTGALYSFRD